MRYPENPGHDEDRTVRDFAGLIPRLKQEVENAGMVADRKEWLVQDRASAGEELARVGWKGGSDGPSHIVTLDRTAFELGPPSLPSLDIMMTTSQERLVTDGKITLLGHDLAGLVRQGHKKSGFVQAVLLALSPGAEPDRFALEKKRYLINRIPGYMVRSVPGRLWVRVDHGLMEKGFSFYHLGCALYTAFRAEVEGVSSCELVLVAGEDLLVKRFQEIAGQAAVLSRENKKLQLDPDGTYSCTDLECDSCEEKPYCDEIRDLIKYRGKRESS